MFFSSKDEANDKHNGNEDSNNEQNSLKQADAIIIARGSKEEDFTYSKTAAMQVSFFISLRSYYCVKITLSLTDMVIRL